MKEEFTHTVAVKLANRLNVNRNPTDIEFTKIVLGIEILLINIPKIAAILCLAALLGILRETLMVFGTFALLRRYASGLHAKKSIVCTLMSVGMFVAVPLVTRTVGIGNHVVALVFAFSNVVFYKFAPADTEARPILGKRKRRSLKYKCLIANNILFILALLSSSENTKLLLSLGVVYGMIAIAPITYKLLGRSRNNYENFE